MNLKIHEIFIELKEIIRGNTLDAVLPPIVFVVINKIYGVSEGALVALILAFMLGTIRVMKKTEMAICISWFLGAAIASGFTIISQKETSYFLPDIIGNVFILVLLIASLIIRKPLAAFLSHVSRGWKLDWYWRKDVKPAYTQVTLFWSLFFIIRLVLMSIVFLKGNVWQLAWMNIILGLPANVIILVTSYLYGTWRLKKLEGPGIDEYLQNKKPPWIGQTRGF